MTKHIMILYAFFLSETSVVKGINVLLIFSKYGISRKYALICLKIYIIITMYSFFKMVQHVRTPKIVLPARGEI